jgi:hypothetical protein
MKLPIELIYKIINSRIEMDVDSNKEILKKSKTTTTTTIQLLLVSRLCYNYIIQNCFFHRLRLWKLLGHIPKHTIQLAVGISDTLWTILEVDIRNERINASQYENFLVLEEITKPRQTEWKKYYISVEQSTKRMVIPYFDLNHDAFFSNLNLFTTYNTMSIWLWRRSNTFFKKDILFNNNNTSCFKPILNTQQKSLLAWDLHHGLTESVMLYNTELFGRLL